MGHAMQSGSKVIKKAIFAVFSKVMTKAMIHSFDNAHNLGFSCVWFHHVDNVQTIAKYPNFVKYVGFVSKSNYIEGFMHHQCMQLSEEAIFVIGAHDEIFTSPLLETIIQSCSREDLTSTSVAIDRIWVKRIGKTWKYSRIASSSGTDFQYRVFVPKLNKKFEKLHSPGFKIKKRVFRIEGSPIIHLDWEVHSVSERREKIFKYAQIDSRQGISKLKYYFPECYLEQELNWQQVKFLEEQELVRWEST